MNGRSTIWARSGRSRSFSDRARSFRRWGLSRNIIRSNRNPDGATEQMETITSKKILSTFDQLEKNSLDLHTLFEFVGGNDPAERELVLDAVQDLAQRGLLREESADFYNRTESGRLIIAGPREITMYMREGCHLCDEAKAEMTRLFPALGE